MYGKGCGSSEARCDNPEIKLKTDDVNPRTSKQDILKNP